MTARTQPDIRDLVVALAAGAAGSYATVRKDASAALPGVAVAVALVPPLGAVGITLEAGALDLALGALLLYITNLAAIIFAGVMVFIATGFVPARRLSNTGLQLLVAGTIAAALVGVVAVPLFDRSADAVAAVQDEVAAREIVDAWLEGRDLTADVDVRDDKVLVQLRGFEPPPDDSALTEQLQRRLGEVTVLVEWLRTERATTTAPRVLSDDETLLLEVAPIVDAWLADASGEADHVREYLAIQDGVVRIDAAGAGGAPSIEGLVDRFREELGTELAVRLNWTERETITPGTTIPPTVRVEEEMRRVVDTWAVEQNVVVESFAYDGSAASLAVIGAQEPSIYGIVEDLEEMAPEEVRGRRLLHATEPRHHHRSAGRRVRRHRGGGPRGDDHHHGCTHHHRGAEPSPPGCPTPPSRCWGW